MTTRILLLGHRGARADAPENTIPAFDLALRHGADGFEFDLRCTCDQRAIICHDPKINALTVRRHTLRQIQESVRFLAERPPCLEDVLERYGRTAFLNIEIKVRGIESLVVAALRKAPPRRGYFVSSFLPGVIRKVYALDRSVVLGSLAQTRWQLRHWPLLPVSYVAPHYRLLSRRLIEKLHAAGKMVVTWTINDPRWMVRAVDMGVDGIISDDLRLLKTTLG